MARRGPDHSSYPQVVSPSKITAVPEVRSVRSRVVPDGTAILSRTIVAQSFFDALAAEASVKVQLALFCKTAGLSCGAAVGVGTAAAKAAALSMSPRILEE